jgi:putative transposase
MITIAGETHWLWWAVDQDGYVLDEIVQARRNTKAAKRLLKRLLKKQGCPPRRMITEKLGSYAAAQRREQAMQGFRSPGGLQKFVSIFSAVRNLFVPPHSRRFALATHLHRLNARAEWKSAVSTAA